MNREDLIKNIYTCASCGYCRFGCPLSEQVGFESVTARGRMAILKNVLDGKMAYTPGVVDVIYMCSQCANCSEMCPTKIDYVEVVSTIREELFSKDLYPKSQKALRENILQNYNPFGEKKEERGNWVPKEKLPPKKSKYLYFAGCSSSYGTTRIARSILRILDTIGFDYTVLGPDEVCCGDPLRRMGDIKGANELQKKNVAKFDELGVETIFASCPGCFKNLKHNYPEKYEVLHITQLFDKLIKEGLLKFTGEKKTKMIYFDGCDLGRHSGVYEEPRNVLKAIPGVELLEFDYNREYGICCGGPLASGFPELAGNIAAERIREANEKGAEILVTSCPTCFVHLKEGARVAGIQMTVQDLPVLLTKFVKRGEK